MSFNEEFCGNCSFFHIVKRSKPEEKDLYLCREKGTFIEDPKDWCTHHIDRKSKWYDGY